MFIAPYLFKTLLLSVMSFTTEEVLLVVDESVVVIGVVRAFVIDVDNDGVYFDGDASLVEDGKVVADVFANCGELVVVVG